mgnify:CR=1 FL=1
MTRAWRKKNQTERQRVALSTLLGVKEPNNRQKQEIETLQKALKI